MAKSAEEEGALVARNAGAGGCPYVDRSIRGSEAWFGRARGRAHGEQGETSARWVTALQHRLEGPMFEGFRAFLKQMEQAIVSNMVDMGRNQSMIDAEAGGEESTAFSIRLCRDVRLGVDL